MIKLTSERLTFRELTMEDDHFLFELDSNEEVQKYCEKKPVKKIEECHEYMQSIISQYETYGFGRWLVFLKETNEFLGWAGLKLEKNVNNYETFIDLGYRILPQFWNKGYMTEAAKVLVQYGFEELHFDKICGYVFSDNIASGKVLQKVGFEFINRFWEDNADNDWYEITKEKYFSEYAKINENA